MKSYAAADFAITELNEPLSLQWIIWPKLLPSAQKSVTRAKKALYALCAAIVCANDRAGNIRIMMDSRTRNLGRCPRNFLATQYGADIHIQFCTLRSLTYRENGNAVLAQFTMDLGSGLACECITKKYLCASCDQSFYENH